MRYEGSIFRPPSEAQSYILQATMGCSWNHCTYCAMYRGKAFRVRERDEILDDIALARATLGADVRKVFVCDGDSLAMDVETWLAVLSALKERFPGLRRVSCYANATNLLDKRVEELKTLREAGLTLLYIGPESGDDVTLKRIAKGADFDAHVQAARRAHEAGMKLSLIFLLGIAGVDRSGEHAEASARLATAMDPAFLSLLTLTVIPGTPIARLAEKGKFELPDIPGFLKELRVFVAGASPTDAIFRTNHASNYLSLAGRIPRDRDRILGVLDAALDGKIPLRPEWSRGL